MVYHVYMLLMDSAFFHLPHHQVLTAQVSDTGRYVCVADNVAGSAEKFFNLNVHGESRSVHPVDHFVPTFTVM